MRGGKYSNSRAGDHAIGRGQALRQFGEALGAPFLAAPIRRRADRDHRSARWHEARCFRIAARRKPEPRRWRRIEGEEPRQLLDPMLGRVALLDDAPLARREQIGERRRAQIDDEVPALEYNGTVE